MSDPTRLTACAAKKPVGFRSAPSRRGGRWSGPVGAALILTGLALAESAFAAGKASNSNSASILPGASSKEPISIDADKLVYFDKEQKAIYTGNVVAIQGDSKLTCSVLTIYLAKNEAPDAAGAPAKDAAPGQNTPPPAAPAKDAPAASAGGDAPSASTSQVKHMDAAGPVTIVSKTQVGTGDRGAFDKAENKVWLFGNVALSDGGNVTKGDKLTYDLTTGTAVVEGGHSVRPHSQFIPSSNDNANDKSAPAKKKAP